MAERSEVVFVDGVRTPFGRAGEKGMYWQTRADDLVVKAMIGLLERNGALPKERVDEVAIAATTQQGDQGLTLGRTVGVLAGLPRSVPGYAIDRMCAGAMTAVTNTAAAIGFGPEIVGQRYDAVLRDAPEVIAAIQQARGGVPVGATLAVADHHFDIRFQPRGAGGFLIATDVTERVTAERAARLIEVCDAALAGDGASITAYEMERRGRELRQLRTAARDALISAVSWCR